MALSRRGSDTPALLRSKDSGLCISRPVELHAQPTPIRLPAETIGELLAEPQPAPGQARIARLRGQRLLDVEARAAVLDVDAQRAAIAFAAYLHINQHAALGQRRQSLLAGAIVAGEAIGIALEPRVQPQHTMLQRIAVELGQHGVDEARTLTQRRNLQEQRQ